MKIRKIIFCLLTVLLLCTAVCAASYTDLSDTHWAHTQIAYLETEITGYPDGTFRPEKSVSRAEFLTLFARIAYPDEWKSETEDDWWKSAYDVCEAHNLLTEITGSRSDPMPRSEIASVLGRFCSGWGGINERADAATQLSINWKEQRMESQERQPLFSDVPEYTGGYILLCANQGLLTGYPDSSFKPDKGVTRAEAAAIIARLKEQILLRKDGWKYVCSVGSNWLVQHDMDSTASLCVYTPFTEKPKETGFCLTDQDTEFPYAESRLLSGSDGTYVWGRAGLFQRSGNELIQLLSKPVLDFCWSGDTLYFLSYDAEQPVPTYRHATEHVPCASQVWKLEKSENMSKLTLVAERDSQNPMQNLTDIYTKNGIVYVAGTYCMGMGDIHGALYEVKDGTLTALFGEN